MPYRLLLADDSLTIQKVVELTFPDPDYELLAVGNGDKAMDALDAFRPDIVLADVVMPGPTGYDICEAVRKRPGGRFVPVVLLTGTFEPFDRARADRVGATAVVTKPFDSHALSTLVRDVLHKAAEERGAAPEETEEEALAGDDTVALGHVPPPPWSPRASDAADLFSEESAAAVADKVAGHDLEEPPELYATSAIPIASLAAYAAPPPAPAPAPTAQTQQVESIALPEVVYEPPPPPPIAVPPPPPPPAAAAVETIAVVEEEPLPPPPAFEAAPPAVSAVESLEPAAAWEMAEEPPSAVEPPSLRRGGETTQPVSSPPETLALEDEPLPPPPAFETRERIEAIDVHSASTPTAIIHPPREPEPLPEAPEEPAPETATPAITFAETVPQVASLEPALPPVPEIAPVPVLSAAPEIEAAPELPPAEEPAAAPPGAYESHEERASRIADEVFAMEEAAPRPAGDEPVAMESAAVPEPARPERELPDLGHEDPVARDIDEDIAAFESHAREEQPAELEALAAGVSLSDLIPPPPPPAAAPRGPLSEEEVDRIARRVAELIGERVIRDIAWEVVPEVAERLVRARLAEIERE